MDISMLAACAAPLEQAAQAREWQGLKERDLQSAVSSVTGAGPRAIKLANWPAVGPVDVVLPDGVALELKWCRSGDTLGNCVWDIAKLACATAEGQVGEGHIVAGAPAWRAHVCPHRWRGERCRPRGWDPEGWGGLPA